MDRSHAHLSLTSHGHCEGHPTGTKIKKLHVWDSIATENSGTRGRSIWVHSSQVGKADSQMGVSRRSRVPERITRPDERFDSSQVGLF